jgi:hypothetical protein
VVPGGRLEAKDKRKDLVESLRRRLASQKLLHHGEVTHLHGEAQCKAVVMVDRGHLVPNKIHPRRAAATAVGDGLSARKMGSKEEFCGL